MSTLVRSEVIPERMGIKTRILASVVEVANALKTPASGIAPRLMPKIVKSKFWILAIASAYVVARSGLAATIASI